MFETVSEHVFPWLRTLGGNGSTYAKHMKDARFTIPTPQLLAKVVDLIDHVPMEDRDTKGDLYEYMLGKIATAGQNGQFRTPRHIIRLMVELTQPKPTDIICDPACGTAGFYESPFTDFSPRGIEGLFRPAEVTALLDVLNGIRAAAA
jgi:type I restriction enzyme M protein